MCRMESGVPATPCAQAYLSLLVFLTDAIIFSGKVTTLCALYPGGTHSQLVIVFLDNHVRTQLGV